MMITRGHPMYVPRSIVSQSIYPATHASAWDYDWYRPDELMKPWDDTYVDALYNLVLDGDDHTVMVNDHTICCTIGRDCGQRLRALHPHHHAKYGPSALTISSSSSS
jgi:hypothetical protein